MGRISGGAGFAGSRTSYRLNLLERLRIAAAVAAGDNAEDLPVMAVPPTVTAATTPTAALGRAYPFAANAALYRVSGGIPVENAAAAGFFVFPVTKIGNGITPGGNLGSWTGDAEDQQAGWAVAFRTDADIVELRLRRTLTAGRNYRLIVDGQYVDRAGIDVSGLSGAVAYVKMDFSGQSAARRMRTITVEGAGSNQHMFAQAAVGPTAGISHPGPGRTDLLALFAGDSFTEGENLPGANKHLAWPYRSAKRLGIARLYDLAIGSTGYVASGSPAGSRRRIVDQIAHDWDRAAFASPDLVVIAAGYNDRDTVATAPAALAAVRTQAQAAWIAIRARFPNALVVVLGVFGGRTGPGADVLAAENGLKAQFDAWGDGFSLWVPVSTDPAPWQFGTGTVASAAGDGNSDLTTSADSVHPSDYGQDVISHRFVAAFRQGIARMAG